jgi:hypothetical protein
MQYMLADMIVRRLAEETLASLDLRTPARPERRPRRWFLVRR